jgi:phosphate transport system protein
MKINNELERIGDRSTDLAQMVIADPRTVTLGQRIGINRITQATFVMIKSSLDSFINNDPELAHHILPTDDTVDRLYDTLHAELVRAMIDDPSLIEPGARIILALHEIERMADHATNIAENVIFLIEAKLVRHRAVNDDAAKNQSETNANNG